MKVAVCLDDRGGMMFGSRRQSMDREQRQMLLDRVGDGKLWMNSYTAQMFTPVPENIVVAEDFLDQAGCADWCFVENEDVMPYVEKITELIIYRWNRAYPATMRFPEQAFTDHRRLVSRQDFPGSSHEQITEEVYVL